MLVQSKTPLWQTADLRLTRIKDDLRGEVLIFKVSAAKSSARVSFVITNQSDLSDFGGALHMMRRVL